MKKSNRLHNAFVGIFVIIPFLIHFFDGLKTYFGLLKDVTIPIYVYLIFWLIALFSFSYFLFYRFYLCKKGVNGVPLQFTLFLKKFNPFIQPHYSMHLHLFQHEISKAINEVILNREYDVKTRTAKERTAKLLNKCQDIIRVVTGIDFSIHIKLFMREDENKSGQIPIENAFLFTYERVPSRKERENILLSRNLPARNNSEKFVISKWDKHNEDKLYAVVETYSGPYKKNLAYDYVLGPSKHYWLSNDLNKDQECRRFISTSENYEKYYNSLGVFIISPPLDCSGQPILDDKVVGLLIIDTLEKNVFHELMFKDMIGYFAHRFYEYINSYQIIKN